MSFTRRMFIAAACLIAGLGVARLRAVASNHFESTKHVQPTATEALALLKEGNTRFITGNLRYPHTGKEWRQGLTKGQTPFATILGCSDSRVPPELLFDQGFGDLFVVRVAGNVVDSDVEGSVEYSVDHCGTRLVVVMGHEGCGAVTAALGSADDISHEPNEIQRLVKQIKPVDRVTKKQLPFNEALQRSVEANVRASVRSLSQVPDLARAIEQKQVMIVGCVYDIATGTVHFLDS